MMVHGLTVSQAQKLTSPNPFCLVSTCDNDGKTNVMALSWWTYCSNKPATVAVCLSQKGYSGSLIKSNGEFAINIVSESIKDAAFKCGCCSGRDTDKAKEFGIELISAENIAPQLVADSRVVFECRLLQWLPVQDHDMFIGEVVAIHADEEAKAIYAFKGYSELTAI